MSRKKPGKYARLLQEKNYPRYRPIDEDDPKRAEKIDAKKRQLLSGDRENDVEPVERRATSLAEFYAEIRLTRDRLKQMLYDTNVELDAVTELMVEQFEVEGITSITLEDGTNVRLQSEPYSQVKDWTKVIKWAKNDPDLQSKVRETVPWQSINGAIKALLLEGVPEPDGIEVYHKVTPFLSRGEEE